MISIAPQRTSHSVDYSQVMIVINLSWFTELWSIIQQEISKKLYKPLLTCSLIHRIFFETDFFFPLSTIPLKCWLIFFHVRINIPNLTTKNAFWSHLSKYNQVFNFELIRGVHFWNSAFLGEKQLLLSNICRIDLISILNLSLFCSSCLFFKFEYLNSLLTIM